MRKILTLLAGTFIITTATAQIDTAAIKKNIKASADAMVAAYRKNDWRTQANYMNENQLKQVGGVEGFISVMENLKQNSINSQILDTACAGDVLQVVKAPTGYQCLIETFRQYTLLTENVQSSGCYYWMGTSADGKAWRFCMIRDAPGEVEEAIPGLSAELKQPPIVSEDIPLKEFREVYRKKYTPVIK